MPVLIKKKWIVFFVLAALCATIFGSLRPRGDLAPMESMTDAKATAIAIDEVLKITAIRREDLSATVVRHSGENWYVLVSSNVVGQMFTVVVHKSGTVKDLRNSE